MPGLTAEAVTAGYGRVPVIRGVSVSATPGRVTTVVGPNGAGKSTLAKSLVGILTPISGRVLVNDVDITHCPGHLIPRRGLAYVPQNSNVFPTLTVRENLEVGGFVSTGGLRTRLDRVAEVFPDLAKALGKKAGQLSGGQQNMLAMARALMSEPSAIVLDEPTAGLSPAYTSIVWQQVEAIATSGTAVLVIEQNVERALTHSHTVYILVAGANYTHGPAAEVAAMDLGGIFLGKQDDPPERVSSTGRARQN